MVHALEEVWRVLKSGGWMVDLRPVSTDWPLDIVAGESVETVGFVDGWPALADQVASDQSIAEIARRGRFVQEDRVLFDLAYYWQTVDELVAYASDSWKNSAVLAPSLVTRADELVTHAGDQSRIRIRRKMEIARYRRVD